MHYWHFFQGTLYNKMSPFDFILSFHHIDEKNSRNVIFVTNGEIF